MLEIKVIWYDHFISLSVLSWMEWLVTKGCERCVCPITPRVVTTLTWRPFAEDLLYKTLVTPKKWDISLNEEVLASAINEKASVV